MTLDPRIWQWHKETGCHKHGNPDGIWACCVCDNEEPCLWAADQLEDWLSVEPAHVTGSINFNCGCRIDYNDHDPAHKALRLSRSISKTFPCPNHGVQIARTAVSAPMEYAHELWPDRQERADVLREVALDKYE